MASIYNSVSPQPSRGVLIHGCNLKTKAFDAIVFGDKEKRGRVPTGVEEAVNKQASV